MTGTVSTGTGAALITTPTFTGPANVIATLLPLLLLLLLLLETIFYSEAHFGISLTDPYCRDKVFLLGGINTNN